MQPASYLVVGDNSFQAYVSSRAAFILLPSIPALLGLISLFRLCLQAYLFPSGNGPSCSHLTLATPYLWSDLTRPSTLSSIRPHGSV